MRTGNDVPSSDFMRVLMALKTNINRDLHVADLAKVIGQNEDGTFTCVSITNGAAMSALALKDLVISSGDIVCLLFIDADYQNNLALAKLGKPLIYKEQSDGLHQRSYGVIIGTIYGI